MGEVEWCAALALPIWQSARKKEILVGGHIMRRMRFETLFFFLDRAGDDIPVFRPAPGQRTGHSFDTDVYVPHAVVSCHIAG